jgi:uncharacterized protein (UPF0276 family)
VVRALNYGVGLRKPHYPQVHDCLEKIKSIEGLWFEVHTDNFFLNINYLHQILRLVSDIAPISFHSVGFSLASCDNLNIEYLLRTKELVDEYNPIFISDHLAWNSIDGEYLHDLLPFPYCLESFDILASKIAKIQDTLKRQILIENPALYVSFPESKIFEADFLNMLTAKTGCGILLDITNLYISSINIGIDSYLYLKNLDISKVHEINISGFEKSNDGVLLDTHSKRPQKEVIDLLKFFNLNYNSRPTLIEYDENIPNLSDLLAIISSYNL